MASINKDIIYAELKKGKSVEEIAKNMTEEFNDLVNKYKNKQQKNQKLEQARKELIQHIINYLNLIDVKIEGNAESFIENKLKKIENREYPFPFTTLFDLFNY